MVVAPESYPTLEGKPHSILPHKIQVQDCIIAWHIVLITSVDYIKQYGATHQHVLATTPVYYAKPFAS